MKKFLIGTLMICAWFSYASSAWAVDPNPLKNAYWRFESGANGDPVAPGVDVVLDTADNSADPPLVPAHMRTVDAGTAPAYTSNVAPAPLRSGSPNNLALSFMPNPGGGGDDIFTRTGEGAPDLNNGIIADGQGFTLEAAFMPRSIGAFQGIVAKEGQPALGDLGGAFEENLPTLALKVRDSGHLQIEQWDADQNLVQITTADPLSSMEWYHAAVVNTGSELSLYLDSNDGNGYQLQGATPVSGALFQGNDDWDHAWTIGRAAFGGGPADWFDGIIDEVRLTNRALAPNEFLFIAIPEPSSMAVACLALAGYGGWWARKRTKI
jgi:hypothetical protein